MAELSSVQGSVTLRKLPTGGTVSIVLQSSMQLFQLYTENASGTGYDIAPNWSGNNTHPTVTVKASSTQGTVKVTSVAWYINNQSLNGVDGFTIASSGDAHTLEINRNLADMLGYNSGTLTADITYAINGGSPYTAQKSEIIRIQQAVSDGYAVFIDATSLTVDETTVAVLTPQTRRGLTAVTDGITYEWYDSVTSNTPLTGDMVSASGALTVNAAMVSGTQLYVCRAKVSGNVVDSESVIITDTSDPLRISASVRHYKGNTQDGATQNNASGVSVGEEITKTEVTFSVVSSDGSPYAGAAAWKTTKSHASTMMLIAEVTGADGYTADTASEDSYNTYSAATMDVYPKDFRTAGASASGQTVLDEVVVTALATLT